MRWRLPRRDQLAHEAVNIVVGAVIAAVGVTVFLALAAALMPSLVFLWLR